MPVYHTAAGTVEMLEWGEGPELFVLLHAAAAGPQSLSALATMLLRPGRRVIAPALDRYGATHMREAADSVQAHVDVLRACIDIHQAKRRVLIGHSMGGLVGLLGAMDGLPLDALALYEPIVTACLRTDVADEVALRDWDRSIVADVEQSMADGDPEAGIAAFINAWNETPWSGLPPSVRARLIASADQLAADMRAVSYHDLPIDRLMRLQTPVLLLQGALSPAVTHAMSARLASLLPHAQQRIIAGCAHMGPVQMPAAIHEAIISSHPALA
jgi:pimeloyl-ACP methyl ester carboxylesterase